uniref:ACT domain-containing protein n=1 Tax=Angiostrongylus cantonensis TaxID=6313 RepID=A0A0K0D0G4_ANGCA
MDIAYMLEQIPAHLKSTQMVLDSLRKERPKSAYVMEPCDITVLRANVPNGSAMQSMLELLKQTVGAINVFGFTIQLLMTLLKEFLNCSMFIWAGSITHKREDW